MKKNTLVLLALALIFSGVACSPEDSEFRNSKCPDGAVDLGIVMTRADGSKYKLYWAKSNLSVSGLCANPWDYGDYYAWGETEPYYSSRDPLTWKSGKTGYNWASYKWCNGNDHSLTKYNTDSSYGTVGNKAVLDSEDDVAHVKLSGKWRMPTDAEWTALREQCTWIWASQNGVNGRLVTAPNGNSIFLPAAGFWPGKIPLFSSGDSPYGEGSDGDYWSSSLNTDYPDSAYNVYFFSDNVDRYDCRCGGLSVRPVSE